MAKIDDFGEKIGGARKDLYALNRELRLEDIADWSEYDREKYITKKEAFPLPDYKKLYEQGIDREVLFFIKEIRDALPTKPSVYIPHKSSPEEKQQLMHKAQEDYINTIGKFYEQAMDLRTISDCMNFYENIKVENLPAINWISNRKLRNVVHLDSYGYHSLLTRMRKKQFLYSDEEKILSNYTIFQYDGSNVEKETDDRQRERLTIKQGGSRYFVYHSEQDPSKWNSNTYFALDSRTHQIKIANMEDVEQLKKRIVDMEETITKEKSVARKKKLVPTQLAHIRPTAEDYRGGKNITGEDMLNTFQFHGGEFGNWESDLDRQTNLNMSFDALNDLAKALEIECADVSLGGNLSIAYGARGISNAAAHFEPGMNVINLTKMKGAGSLAHEWGHALDYYIGLKNGGGVGFATEKPSGKMKELMSIMKYDESGQTEYYKNAKLLDLSYGKSGHKGYWQSDVELFARAFASYVSDKLQPEPSDYLAGHSEMSGLVEKNGKLVSAPISPQGEERRRINEAMDALIEELKEHGILHQAERLQGAELKTQINEEVSSDIVIETVDYSEELKENTPEKEKIVKLTGQPVSLEMQDILRRLSEKQYVSLEEINATKEMKIARSNINYACPTIQLDNRLEIQVDVLNKMNKLGSVEFDENGKVIVDSEGNTLYNGRVERNSRLDIVIGLPASGKSSAIANSISNEFHSKVIDNDEAKKKIPQYNDGWGSGVVHEESQYISDSAFRMAIQNHENIVLPKVGSNAEKLCDSYIIYAKEHGYEVNVHYVELDRNKALGRMINRFIEDGRFLEPNLIEKYDNPIDGNRIETAYETLKLHSSVDGYSKWNNDVARGEQPILVEVHNLTGNYIINARHERNEAKGVIENERNANISTIDSGNYGESRRNEPESSIENERGQRGYYTQHESERSVTSNEQVLQVVDDQLVSENNKDEIVEAVERSIEDTFSTASSVRKENVPMDENFKQMDRVGEEPTQKQVEYAIRIANLLDIELPDDNSKKTYAEFISENQETFNRTRYERASSVNILDYARSQGLELKRNGRDYRVANFSGGFIISPDKNNWNYFTADAGGGVIQLCMFLENKTFQEAVDTLVNEDMDMIRHSIDWTPSPEEPKEFILPERNHTNSHVMEYLTQIRGIDKEIVQTMIDQDYIYENTYKSCVFVGKDKEGIPRHASVRSTNTQGDAYKKDVFGSQKKYSFSIPGTSGTLNVFEAPIDVLSYMSIRKLSGEQMNDSYLSLGGTSDKALERYLEDHNDIQEIKVCTDADEAGNKAAEKIQEKYGNQYRIIREKAMHKDFNEDLIAIVESRKEENKSETQKVVSEHHPEKGHLEHILQMVNDFSKLYGEANTPFLRDGFQYRLSEILTEYKKAIDSNPDGVIALLPTFFVDPNPNEIDIRGNRLWNEFWQALERYGITGDEKFSSEINSIATNPDTQEKALSIMKSIQQYLDDRLYVHSYMKDGNVVNVDCISHYKNIVSNDILDAVFFRDTENGNVMADAVKENDKQYQEFSVAHHEFIANKEVSRIPVVINAFGGPGSGKSVSCMDICQQLKKLGYNAEYVQEYAKDLVYDENWDMLDGSPENQFEILKEQLRRVDRLYGTVDFIVTDSPVLLNSVYNKSLTLQYDNMVTSLYKDFQNFTYFVERDTSSYQQEGRIQNLEESQKIDEEIKQLLAEKEVYYGTYNHDTINKIVSNSIKTFNRINHITEEATAKQIAYAEKIATTLNIDLPEENTKEAYRFFISENQEAFANSNAKLSDVSTDINSTPSDISSEKSLEEQVEDVLSGKANQYNSIKVCDTPQLLIDVGCEQLPMLFSQKHLKDTLKPLSKDNSKWHGLTEQQIKMMPELLKNPVMVYDSQSQKNSIVIVTSEFDTRDFPIIISVRPNGSGIYELRKIDSNYITSAYGRRNFSGHIVDVIQNKDLLYWNKEKSQALFMFQGLQLPEAFNNLDSDKIIRQSSNIVNQNIGSKYDLSSDEALTEAASTAETIYQSYLEKVSQNGNLLKDVPEEYHTEELLLAAVSNWGAAIRNVPADKLTSAIVLASVTQYGTNLRHVPKTMRSEEVCVAAYVNSAGKAIRYAPNEIKDTVKVKAQEILANNNTSISSSKRQVEVEQLQEQGQEWATQISNMLREHETDPEAMVEDIISASKFYQYSVKNIQIMRRQNPGMTFVASASSFEQMGYHVNNGEKAMIARVPSFSKYVIDENGEYIYASKYTPEIKNKIKQGVLKEHEKITRYVFRPALYDISQTDCPVENYPSMFYMGVPSELHQEAFNAMKEFAEDSLGFKVMTVDLKSISLRGNCEPDNKIIRVNDKLESTMALSTLCHEIAYGIIHTLKESEKMTTAQKECEADVMAIMLESSLGLAISESRREHLYHAFHTYKDEQAAKEHPYEVTLEKLIDRVQKKVFRPYAEDIKYYLALHLPADGVENDNVARNLVKDMALFDSAYQLHFNLSIDPEHELFAEDKIELYRTLYQQTKEEYRLGNSFVPKLAVIKDFGKDETFLTSVQFIDKETVDTIKNLSAHVTQEYLPLQIELGDVLAIKENVLEDSQLYIVTEQGLQPLSDKLNQELENKINCGFDVSTEYQCIRNLLQNNIEILSDTIPEYYNHICERFGYTKDVAQTTSNQFMARINLITEGMSSNDKELIAEYVFRTGNYQKAEKYAEKLQTEPGISKQLLQEMRLIDSYKYMLWTIADYEDAHSVSGEKRITTGAYNNASIPLLSENAHSLSQINECFLEIKKHNAPESVKYYSIVTEEEGYRIGYVELDDYVPSIKYSTGVYSSYEEAKEFYNLYLETANSHLVAAAQANQLVDLEKEANLIALSDVTAIGNTIADEKYRFKELGVTENDLLNLLRDKIDNYQDVNSIHTIDASVQILKDFKQTINDFGEKHFVELCNLDDFSDINVMEESLQVANWLSKQREVIANCGQNGIEDVTQLIDMAMDSCVTTADLEQAYNAIDAVVLNSEYSNLKAHFDGYEDYNSAFDTLKSSFVTADKFCYIDYKADDIPMLYTSDPAGNVYKKSLRNEWTDSVQEMYGKLQKAGYEVCSNFDDFKAYAMNNRLAVPGAPERKKEGVYVRVIESTSDLLTKGQTLSVYDFKNHMDKIYSGSSEANNCVTYKLVTRNNQEIQSYIDTYSGDVNMNVYEKLYDKVKEQSPELCKLIGKQYYQDVIDFSERHLMKPLLEQLKEQGKTEIDSKELQNLTNSCDKLKEVIKELDLSPAEAEILKLNVGSMQVGQVADIQRQMQLQQNQQLQKQRNKQNEGISLV